MASEIGGWNVVGVSTANAPAVAQKPAKANFQHIIYGISGFFSVAPAALVPCVIVCPDVSPNLVLWAGVIQPGIGFTFPAGICGPKGGSVEAVLGAGGGSLVGTVNLHGITR